MLWPDEWRLRLAWNEGDQRFPIDPAPLTQVQEALKSDETLLEYVLASQLLLYLGHA